LAAGFIGSLRKEITHVYFHRCSSPYTVILIGTLLLREEEGDFLRWTQPGESAFSPPGLTDKKRLSFPGMLLERNDDWKDAPRPPCRRTRIFQDSPARKGVCHVVCWPELG
jgi:hypothetical protein